MALLGLGAMLSVGVLPALGQAATTTTLALSSAGAPVTSGGSIVSPAQLTLTAAVTAGGAAVTKGTVNFCVTGAKICTDVNRVGSAQLTTAGTAIFTFVPPISKLTGATPVPRSYTAIYAGTTADAASTSAASTVTVTGTFPTTSVLTSVQTATAPPTNLYTLTDTVTGPTQNYPTGTVTFQDTSDNNYVLGTATLNAATSAFVLTAKPLVYSTSGSEFPRYVAVGDVNGDGIPDLAVANFTGNPAASVDIYFGNGDGTFTFKSSLTTGTTLGPQFAVLGDFNNDGCLDVLSESYNNNNIQLYLNTKTAGACTGTFQAAKTFAPAGLSGPGGLAIGDFNRDGNLDFVVNNNNAPGGTQSNQGINSLVFFGDGAGNFTAGPILAPGGTVNAVYSAVGDYNGDGYLDIALANDVSSTLDIYLNNGTGGFGTSNGATPTPSYTPNTVITTPVPTNILLTADFNQDGKLDLAAVSGNTSNPITIYTGTGTGTFTQQAATAAPVGAVSAASAAEADFNGDGIPDLVFNTAAQYATGLVGVLLGKGDGTFAAPTTTYSTLGEDSLSLAVGDFNGDGYSDVAVGNFSGDIYNADGSGNAAAKYKAGDVSVYLAGYQTTGTTTASLTGVFVNGVATNPHNVDAVFPTNSIYSTSTSNTVPLVPSEVMNDTLSLMANPAATTYGQQTVLTATLTNYSSQNYTTNGEAITFTLQNTNTVIGSVNLATGVATLNYTALPVGTDNIVANYTSDGNFASAASNVVQVVVTAAPGTGTLTANPQSTTYGTPVLLTDTFNPINGVCPTGSATFTYNGAPIGMGAVTLVGGKCTATLTTANLPVGNDPITATVPASGNFGITNSGPTAVTVAKAPVNNTPTLAALSQTFVASPGTITAGGTESLVYTVPVVSGNTPPTGPVVFSSPGLATPITCSTFTAGTLVAATSTVPAYTPYSCTSTTTALAVGSPDVVTATYSATDPNYANTPALTQNVFVNAATVTTTLVANPTPSTYGTPVTLTETIAPINGTCPAGPATFFNGTTQLGTGTISLVGSSCVATLTTANLPVGTDPLKVTVPASGPFAAITTNGSTTVSAAPITNGTTPVLSQSFVASPGTITAGATETFTYTIPVAAGNTPPTGPVVFSSPGLATPITCSTFTAGTPVTGTTPPYTPYSCTSTTTALAVGSPDLVTATYTTGDPNYLGGAPALTQNVFVNAATVTTTLVANPTPSTYGTPVTLTETIAPINGTCPAGPATFFNGTIQLGMGTISLVGSSCVATLTTANLPVGTDPLKVTVPASGPFAAITTNGSTTVSAAPITNGTTPVLSQSFVASPGTITAGGTETFTYTIPVAGGNTPPTGPVVFSSPGLATPITCSTFTAGTPVTGTTPPYTPYSCTSTTTALAVGSPDLVTATYTTGDPNYLGGAPALTQNVFVNAATVTTTLVANPTPSTYGTPVTLTETIAPINGTCPAGPATFFNGTTQLGTGTISLVGGSCVATLTTANLPVGTDPLKVTVPASGPFAAITTNGSTTVSKAPVTNGTTPVLSQSFVASPSPSPAGGLVTLVYTIPVAAGNVAPIGPVVFSSPGLATPITCSTFTAGTPVTGTTPPYTPYSCTSTTTALAVGNPDVVTATYTSADLNYANAPALTQNVIVTPVTPGNVITVPPTTPACGTSVTLTDTITPVNGIPVAGGTVQFYDNGTPIGPLLVVPSNGIVTLTTTALNCGPNVITSVYTPPAGSPYLPAPGGPVNFGVNVADFTIAATPPNQVVNPGGTVVYTISLAGATVPFNSPVTLTVTGLPKDATVSFGKTTYVPGQGPTTTTMTIVTSPLHSELRGYPGMGGGSKIAFGLLLLPLLGVRRIRRKLKALPRGVMYGLTALLLLAGLGAVTGCGGGYIGPNPGFYTLTVTGTSGTLVHSTTVQLEVR